MYLLSTRFFLSHGFTPNEFSRTSSIAQNDRHTFSWMVIQDTRFLEHDFELSSVERPKGTNLPGDSPDADLPDGGSLSESKLSVGTT
jgi:hypothetical protein